MNILSSNCQYFSIILKIRMVILKTILEGDYAQTTASIRYAQANNPYMHVEYDPNKESSYIIPFDANKLYGYTMSQPLPCGEYEWCNPANMALEFSKNMILKHVIHQFY